MKSLLKVGPGNLFRMIKDEKRKNLTRWEKAAIVIIVILILVITALIFRDHIEGYIKIFVNWYRSEG